MLPRTPCWTLVVLAVVATLVAPAANADEPTPKEAAMEAPIRTINELVALKGQPVQALGTYEIVSIAPRRIMKELPSGETVSSSKIVVLVLQDSTRIKLWVRPQEEMDLFGGKTVVVTATAHMPDPAPAHMAAPEPTPGLIDITHVAPYEK